MDKLEDHSEDKSFLRATIGVSVLGFLCAGGMGMAAHSANERRACYAIKDGVFDDAERKKISLDFLSEPSVQDVVNYCKLEYGVVLSEPCVAKAVVHENSLYSDHQDDSPDWVLLGADAANIVTSIRDAGREVCPAVMGGVNDQEPPRPLRSIYPL